MGPYIYKVVHVEINILNLPPILQNRNAYPREENCCDEYSRMVPVDDEHSCDTIISYNTDGRINSVPESRYSVLSYIHISGAKYRIESRKIETATNITIHRMTERIESNKMSGSTDDEGEIHLLISLKCTVIVAEPNSSIQNTPYYRSCVICETKVGNYQHNIEATTDHYSREDYADSCLARYFI